MVILLFDLTSIRIEEKKLKIYDCTNFDLEFNDMSFFSVHVTSAWNTNLPINTPEKSFTKDHTSLMLKFAINQTLESENCYANYQ